MATSKFEHTPLDRTIQSLRLVHLLPELSSNGFIQCSIHHATTTARYICLSYRWGEDETEHERSILIDGKPFAIRRNLFEFLQVMQSTSPPDDPIFDSEIGYWIDALCIDQSNTLERNHQVAQMGSIFSRAGYVHVWLGRAPGAERIRRLVDGPGENMSLGTWSSLVRQDMEFLETCIFRNEYWTRAWVVQEIVLAKYVEVSLDIERFPFSQFIHNIRSFCLNWTGTHFEQFAFDTQGTIEMRDQSLLNLIDRFQDKRCSLVHDRVFSLLSLCRNGSDLKVNYDLSRSMLAYLALRTGPKKLCICSARVVARNLGLGEAVPLVATEDRESFLKLELLDFKLSVSASKAVSSLTISHPSFQDKYHNWTVTPSSGSDPYKGRWPGCIGHWITHLAKTLCSQLHLHLIEETLESPIQLSSVLYDTKFLKHDQKSCPPGWSRLSSDILLQVPDWDENLCAFMVPLSTLLTQCSYLPRLCVPSLEYVFNHCPPAVALSIRVALA